MFFDSNYTIGILGLLLSVISIVIAVLYRSKRKIVFYESRNLSLFDSAIKDIEGIEIKYSNSLIKDNLIIYKGHFINVGNEDIDKSYIHEPIAILLPKGYEWKSVSVKSKEMKYPRAIAEFNRRKCELNWDVFRKGESIQLDSVIEYIPQKEEIEDKEEYLSENINFEHRITNLKRVNRRDVPEDENWIVRGGVAAFLMYLIVLCFPFILETPNDSISFERVRFEFVREDSSKEFGIFRGVDESTLKFHSKGLKSEVFSVHDLPEKLTGKVQIVKKVDEDGYGSNVFLGILSFIMLIYVKINVFKARDKLWSSRINGGNERWLKWGRKVKSFIN